MNTIKNQIANDNAVINNAEQINNNIFDDPLKFFCDKKENENQNLKPNFQVIQYLINKDNLKARFGGANYKYDELVNFLEKSVNDSVESDSNLLDDGYKSVIKCIVKTVLYFKISEDKNCLATNSSFLYAEITSSGLKLKFSEKVKSYEIYHKVKKEAEKIIEDLAPYLNCATQYGNFFQFNHIFLEDIKNVPFLTEEIKFHVSNEIIPNLIKPLYGECPECGLREIIQNACDASKELKSQNVKNIEVHLFKENGIKKIQVRDYGIGMTKDVLISKYFVIGESSKKTTELNLVGQFGIGALAAFLLGDTVEVRTKHYKEEKVYHFLYTLESNQEGNINVDIEQDSNFLHGTEVTITINKNLAKLSAENLKYKLKLDEWYVLPDIPIDFYIDSRKQEIKTLRGDKYEWKEIDVSNDNLKVKYLDKNKNSQVILNGLAVPERYTLPCKYLRNGPYISVQCYDNAVKLNLERSRIEIGLNPILEGLQEELIKAGLEQLEKDKDLIVSDGIIKFFSYNNFYLNNIPLFFCKEGFGIFSISTLDNLKEYQKIVKIYGKCDYNQIYLNSLSENVLYLFYNHNLEKSEIADLIEGYGITYIPIDIVRRFFYLASSQHNGFRIKTMKILYKILGKINCSDKSVSEFWQNHNKQKENLFQDIFKNQEVIKVENNTFRTEINENYESLFKIGIINISDFIYCNSDLINDNDGINIKFTSFKTSTKDNSLGLDTKNIG